MKTSTANYLIKPTEQWANNKSYVIGSTLEHAILRINNYAPKSTNVKPASENSAVKKHEFVLLGKVKKKTLFKAPFIFTFVFHYLTLELFNYLEQPKTVILTAHIK